MESQRIFSSLIKGDFDTLPEEKSNSVRIFLSSTFSDTHAERDYLIEKIYPELKTYCKTKYGLDFQVVDMRWGISSEASIDHSTTDICLNEIRNCQNNSFGPNFIALLSHRYGARPLPNRIIKDEFEILNSEIESMEDLDLTFESNTADLQVDIKNMLKECYKIDENQVPKAYELLNIDQILPGYTCQKEHEKLWTGLSEKLCTILRKLAQTCFDKGLIEESQFKKYFVSVTENEIQNGILDADNIGDKVIYFERNINPIPYGIVNKRLSKFFNVDSNYKIDEDVDRLLKELKNRLREKLPRKNIIQFQVGLDLQKGISFETHRKYIEDFGKQFYDTVVELIDKNAQKKYFIDLFNENDKNLLQEIISHAKFSKAYVTTFHGRVNYINRVMEYIVGDSKFPFVIYGDSGSGKTSLISIIVNQLLSYTIEPDNYLIILRFLGTSPATSNVMSTFKSIVYQIERLLDEQSSAEKSFERKVELKRHLEEKIRLFSRKFPNKRLVILLDSVDQLIKSDYDLEWMIYEFPSNVKLVLSTLEDHGDILKQLKRKITNENDNYLKLEPLDQLNVKIILADWLSKANRSLSETQWQILNSMFGKATLNPLYVKLIFDITSKWKSFYKPDDKFLKVKKIENCIKYLFKLLEKEHGRVLFPRCVFYMSVMKNGISKNELEDILSLDDDLLSNIFEFHSPPIRRFPIALWSRIKYALKEYLVEKEIDDVKVISWYHRRFIEVSDSVYVETKTKDEHIENIIDYFTGKWSNKKKPFKHNEYYAKKKHISRDSEAYRYVNDQLTVCWTESGDKRANKRKLSELPFILDRYNKEKAGPLICQYVYFDYEFLCNKFLYTDIQTLNDEMPFIRGVITKRETRIFMFLLASCLHTMKENPDNIAIELHARTLSFHKFYKYLKKFIDESDKRSIETCALVVSHQYLKPPGCDAISTLDAHTSAIKSVLWDRRYLITCSDHIYFSLLRKLTTFGRIEYPVSSILEDMKLTLVYFIERPDENDNFIKGFNGGYVIMSNSIIMSCNFDETVLFRKDFTDRNLENIFLMPEKYLIVQFKEKAFYEIYDLFTGEIVFTSEIFKTNIKFMFCSMSKDWVIELKKVLVRTLIIVFEDGEIQKYDLKSTIPLIVYKIPANGLKFISGTYYMCEHFSPINMYILTLQTGGFCIFFENLKKNSKNEYTGEILFVQPALENNSQLQIKYLNVDDILFTDADGNLYLMKLNDKKILMFHGNYQLAKYVYGTKNQIIASSNGSVYFFQIPKKFETNNKEEKVLPLLRIDAHHDDLISFLASDVMLVTVSKDNKFKTFQQSIQYGANDLFPQDDYSDLEQTKILLLQNDHVLTYSETSRGFDKWKCNTGTIVLHKDVDFDTIINIVVIEDTYFILGLVNYDQSTRYMLKVFTQQENNIILTESFTKIYQNAKRCHLIEANHNSIFLLTETIEDSGFSVKVYQIEYAPKTPTESVSSNLRVLSPNEMITICRNKEITLSSFCISKLSQLLVIAFELELYLYDLKAKQLVFTMSLKNSVETDKINSFHLKAIENTDDTIGILNSSQIFYISCINNKLENVTQCSKQISKIDMQSQIVALSDQSEGVKIRLLVYNLDQIKAERTFEKPILELSMNKLEHFILSPDANYLATFEKTKYLSLYRLKDKNRCAYIKLHNGINSMIITDKFVSLAMKENRIVSFLIVDRLEPNHLNRIKELPSRSQENEVAYETYEKFIQYLNNTIDNETSLEVNEDIFEDHCNRVVFTEEEEKLRKKIKMFPLIKYNRYYSQSDQTASSFFKQLKELIEGNSNSDYNTDIVSNRCLII